MDKIEDVVEQIEVAEKKLVTLEAAYEAEEDETKILKLETKIDRVDKKLNGLITKADSMRAKEAKEGKEVKEEEEEEEDCCLECGGDLYDVGEGLLYCEKCEEYYEQEES